MKKTIALLLVTALTITAHAIEFVTLTDNSPSRSVNAPDLVQVVGTNKNNYGTSDNLVLTFADGSSHVLILRGKEAGASVQQFNDMRDNVFTGLSSVSLSIVQSTGILNKPCVTLKITPADEIGAAAQGTVIVLPENTTGDFNLVVECSDDLVSWSVFSSQVVDAATAKNFYRTRLIKVTAP